jgi:site-specific DNA-methyltransferase (adenine-specific)
MVIKLFLGDCLEILPNFQDKCIDAIMVDLPYGNSKNKWDTVIPFGPMWEQINRINKGVFITTAKQPFASELIVSNKKQFRQELIWNKVLPVGFLDANRKHLSIHENILLFCSKGYGTYNPIKTIRGKPRSKVGSIRKEGTIYGNYKQVGSINNEYFPTSIITISNGSRRVGGHPTQKPVLLYEYLIKTYTNIGDTVLDFCMGSGTTGEACKHTGRNFIGIEKDDEWFNVARNRLEHDE